MHPAGEARSPTSIVVRVRPAASDVGEEVRLVASVSAGGGTPTGAVVIRDGALMLGAATLLDGRATFRVRLFSPGVHVIEASFAGDERHDGCSDICRLQVRPPAV